MGIAKALYVGTTLNVAGASTLAAITGTFNGTVGATTPSTGAFTTLSATGTITSTKSGYVLQRTGVDTGYQAINLGNTGADCYLGAERSTGSGILNGSTGYALVISNASNVPVQIGSNNVVVATFKQGGSLALENATTSTGCGISFPATQSASTDANTLDDYEEGTWTPTITSQVGSITTLGAVSGKYTKIGNTVFLWVKVAITVVGTASGDCNISGIPFSASQSGNGSGVNSSNITIAVRQNSGTSALFCSATTGGSAMASATSYEIQINFFV